VFVNGLQQCLVTRLKRTHTSYSVLSLHQVTGVIFRGHESWQLEVMNVGI